ncbi:gallinacin-9-like [Elgaria multicarinata webbii]|uniref:gallinacin-9-like n=1 Tax=Elgaria multicarinata webbii TaxID=159646 RepID=UPI002FCCF189
MRALFLIVAVFLLSYQAAPGNAQAAADTLACRGPGLGCQVGPCRPPAENVGTCRDGALSCCKW